MLSIGYCQFCLLRGIIASNNATHCHLLWHVGIVVCPSVCHTLLKYGWNEMPFGSDTYVIPSNIVLDRAPRSTGRGDVRVGTLFLHFIEVFDRKHYSGRLIGKLSLVIIITP